MTPWIPTLVSVAIISLVSLVGLLTLPFNLLRKHAVLFSLIALAAGTLIGDAFFHLIPEGVELWGEFTLTFGALVITGFLMFYVVESALRWGHAHGEEQHEQHDRLAAATVAKPAGWTPAMAGPRAGSTSQRPPNVAAPSAKPTSAKQRIQAFGVLNLIGDALHNFLDGIVVAAAFLVDTPTGVATAVAVAIHELPQEFGDFGVLLRAGFRPLQAAGFNLLSAIFAVAGAVMLLALPFDTETLEKFALPIVAGGFLYIASADLVPELHHHTRARYVPGVLALLLAGIGLMAALTLLE